MKTIILKEIDSLNFKVFFFCVKEFEERNVKSNNKK